VFFHVYITEHCNISAYLSEDLRGIVCFRRSFTFLNILRCYS